MASILKVDTIQDQDGNNIINESANTITIGASGDTINVVGTLQNNGSTFAQGITMADSWRLTADKTSSGDFTSNLERVDETSFGGIGTGMTESSGIFSFPQTGIYLIRFNAMGYGISGDNVYISILVTTNNSTYDEFALNGESAANTQFNMSTEAMVDVTDISNVKVKFNVSSINVGSTISGNTNSSYTTFTFIRLGDT